MASVVYKYELTPDTPETKTEMPKGAQVLSVGSQYTKLHLWAMVDLDEMETEIRRFHVLGTGHGSMGDMGAFIGTVHMMDGRLVLHVFEAI